jgi:DNA recombination protein RmuC
METALLIAALGILAVLALLAVLYLRKGRSGQDGEQGQAVLMLQQQIDGLRGEVSQSLRYTGEQLAGGLKATTETVNSQLSLITAQLANVTQQLQNNTGQVGDRLDNAARVIQDVRSKLGELGEATREIKELGQSVSRLDEMLRAPKFRGGFGEALLEDLLKQVLPSTYYNTQYAFKSGEKVDAVIKTSGGIVPIDSKFPLENFRRMVSAQSDQEKKAAARVFATDVRKHIDSIAKKYILPDEGTFDFAMMYIPAENIYYEVIIKDESFGEDASILSYATQRRVVPVSPNSLYAHLMVIAQGLRGLQIERRAREIYQHLQRLTSELQKFSDVFETLGTHLTNAKNSYDKADKQLNSFGTKLQGVQSLPDDSSAHGSGVIGPG